MNCRTATTAALALVGPALLLLGCQKAASTANVNRAEFRQIENTVTLPQAFDEVWQRLNVALSDGPFEVTASDYESGALQVVSDVDSPSDYIDCGESIRAYTSPMGGTNVYRYQIADSSSYKGTDAQGRPYSADRSTSLQATSYVVLARLDAGTKIAVESQYVFEESLDVDASDAGRGSFSETTTASFGTNERSEGVLNCVSTGRLERMILGAAQPPQ